MVLVCCFWGARLSYGTKQSLLYGWRVDDGFTIIDFVDIRLIELNLLRFSGMCFYLPF